MIRYLADRQLGLHNSKRIRGINSDQSVFPQTGIQEFRELKHLNPYPERPVEYKMLFLKRRSKVQEIISISENLLITLQHSGICCVFRRSSSGSGRLIQHGYLNHKPEEIVRSLFYNRAAAAIVIVSVYPAEKKSVLRCRSIAVADVENGHFDRSVPVLSKEILGYPGWIELCEVNAKILTFSAETQAYKVWDLKDNYAFQYEIAPIKGERLMDVKASPGFLLLIYEPTVSSLEQRFQRISLLDIHDGKELYFLNYPLRTHIDLVEQFCDSILIKEKDHDLVIHNVRKPCEKMREVHMGPNRLNAFTFLHSSRVFLTFQSGGKVSSFDSVGNEIKLIHKDEPGLPSDDYSGIVLVARDQETLLSVRNIESRACVEFRHVITGNLIARVPLSFPVSDVTCICYDEEKMTLFVGTREGIIHVWEV